MGIAPSSKGIFERVEADSSQRSVPLLFRLPSSAPFASPFTLRTSLQRGALSLSLLFSLFFSLYLSLYIFLSFSLTHFLCLSGLSSLYLLPSLLVTPSTFFEMTSTLYVILLLFTVNVPCRFFRSFLHFYASSGVSLCKCVCAAPSVLLQVSSFGSAFITAACASLLVAMPSFLCCCFAANRYANMRDEKTR